MAWFTRAEGWISTAWMTLGLSLLAASLARADTVTYTLDNVVLDDNNAVMNGTFVWTYTAGDFENGSGQFTFLDIPFTVHDHTDLDAAFDIGNSIEITLVGSVHDDGVDISLFLLQPLTPTTGSALDLTRSAFDIGGNGFHAGAFLGGAVVPAGATDAPGLAESPAMLMAWPNPFGATTTVTYSVAQAGPVRLVVHDVRGRRILTLVDRWEVPGAHAVDWSGVDLAPGVYFLRCETGTGTDTRKVVRLD